MTKIKPNIVRGGTAIDLGNNLYLMSGRKHSQGGIDIGSNPRTGLEVEGEEIVQTSPSSLRVFSAQPILGGISPAEYILGGANPNKVFAAQENWKRINRVDDDGTKYITGGKIDKGNFKTVLNKKNEEKFQNWYKNVSTILNIDSDPDNPAHAYDYRGYWLENRNKDIDYTKPDFHFTDTYKKPDHPTFSNESKYASKKYGIDPKTVGHWDGENFISGSFNDLIATRTNRPTKQLEYSNKPYEFSKEVVDYLKGVEGFSGDWYQDGKGIWTVGYGFTGSKVRKMFPNGMTREQADKYLIDSLNVRKQILQRDTPNWDSLNQNQRDALLSYHYNIGEGNYRDKSPKMQEALRNKDWEQVSANMDYGYYDDKNKGLRKRRDYERNLFNTPVEYEYGGIHIKPSKRGTFTAAASKHGMGVQAFASKVLANKDDYSPAMVKKANFARNASKWNHKEFGGEKEINMNKKVKVKDVLSYLPVTGTFIDAHKLATEPSMENALYFLTSLASDVTGYSILKSTAKAAKYLKGAKRAAEISKNIPALGSSYLLSGVVNRVDQVGFDKDKEEKKLGGNMDFNYIIGKNNIYKLGGRRKAINGLELYPFRIERPNLKPITTQDLHKGILYDRDGNALFDTTDIEPSIVVADRVYKAPDLTSVNKETDNYIANLNTDLNLLTPTISPIADTKISVPKLSNSNNAIKTLKGTGVGADLLGLGINLAGNLASSLINRRAIKGMNYYNIIPLRANKLNTRFNINPQIDETREQVAEYENDVTRNTADSRTALARRQGMRARGNRAINQMYGQKENIETQLSTRDRLNQQQVDNQNRTIYNNWLAGLSEFENRRREMLAENAVAGINNAADAIAGPQGYLARRERRIDNDNRLDRDSLDLEIFAKLNPNASPILQPIIEKRIEDYKKQVRRRRGII